MLVIVQVNVDGVFGTKVRNRQLSVSYKRHQILSRLQNRSTVTVKGTINKSKQFKLLNAGKAVALTQEP